MWVRYITKKCKGPPNLGLSETQRGRQFNIDSLKNRHWGAPKVAAFIMFWSMGASAPIFIFYPIKVLPIQNWIEPSFSTHSI